MTDRVNSYRNIGFNFVSYNHCTYFGSNGSGRTRSNNERNENRAKFPHYEKNQKVVCGELAALVGYIPGVEITTDTKTNTIELKVKAGHD